MHLLEDKLREEAYNKFEAVKELEIRKGKVMAYQTQLLELNMKMERTQKDNKIEIDKIKWETEANLQAKDI